MASAAQPSLIANLKVQRRVLGALLIRELLTRYGRHNIGFSVAVRRTDDLHPRGDRAVDRDQIGAWQ